MINGAGVCHPGLSEQEAGLEGLNGGMPLENHPNDIGHDLSSRNEWKKCTGTTFHAASFTRHLGTRCASDCAQISRSTASERAHRRTPSTSTQPAAALQSAAQSHPLELALECSRRRGFHNRLRLTATSVARCTSHCLPAFPHVPAFCALT